MDKEAALGLCYFTMGIIGWLGYLVVFGVDNNVIAAGSVAGAVLGIHTVNKSIQRQRMAQIEAHMRVLKSITSPERITELEMRVTELESKQRD